MDKKERRHGTGLAVLASILFFVGAPSQTATPHAAKPETIIGGGCAGGSYGVYAINIYPGENSSTWCPASTSSVGTFGFDWQQTAYEWSTTKVEMQTTTLSNGYYTGNVAVYGPYWNYSNAGPDKFWGGFECDLLDRGTHSYTSNNDLITSTSSPAYAKQFVYQGGSTCDSSYSFPYYFQLRGYVGGLGWPGPRMMLGSTAQRILSPLWPLAVAGRDAATSGQRRVRRSRKGKSRSG